MVWNIARGARGDERDMVVVHVKGETEEQQFLYECPSTSTVDDMADAVLELAALQSKIQSLSLLLRQRLLTQGFRESYPDAARALERTLSEAETYASKDQVMYKRLLSPHNLRDHIKGIEKEVKTAQSMSLPDFDLPQLVSDCRLHDGTQLWWAGKELVRGKKLCNYIGENEKTKIIIRLKSA